MNPPNPTTFWQGVEHIVAIASIIGVIIAWRVAARKKETRKIEPNPIRTRRVLEKATEDNCKERHIIAMEALETMARQNDDEHKRLYDQIDTVERRAEDNVKATVKDINKTLLDMPDKIIDLLGKTGQLKNHNRSDK